MTDTTTAEIDLIAAQRHLKTISRYAIDTVDLFGLIQLGIQEGGFQPYADLGVCALLARTGINRYAEFLEAQAELEKLLKVSED